MKHIPANQLVLSVALLAAPLALAQSPSSDPAPSKLELPQSQSANRFSLSYRMGFNVPVSFNHLGGYPALSAVRYTPDGDRYNYDNGYVLVDSSGNAMGYTRYWGYDSANQVSGNNAIVMQRSSSEATASSKDHDDTPMSGVELAYNRELIRKESWRGGLEGAFGYTYLSVQDVGTGSTDVTRVSDAYLFPGSSVPESPGYTGGYSRPGQVIAASPLSSTSEVLPGGASLVGQREFSANLLGFRLGPYLEIPLSRSIAFTLSGGFALVYVSSDFSFNETVTIRDVGSVGHRDSGSGDAWLAGGYIAGSFSVALSDSWALVAGAQFEDVGRYTQTLSGKQATLDLSSSIFVTIGLSIPFNMNTAQMKTALPASAAMFPANVSPGGMAQPLPAFASKSHSGDAGKAIKASGRIKLLLVDDHPVVRKGISSCLARHEHLVIVGEAADGFEAVTKAKELLPDIVLLDIDLPHMSGLAVTEVLRKELPQVKVLILSMHQRSEYLLRILHSGARGYVLKEASSEELVKAIETVNAGEAFFSAEIARLALNQFVQGNGGAQDLAELTNREREVLTLVAEGLSNKEIARHLGVGVRTVETHRERIMRKLNIHSIAGLTRLAVAKGLITLRDELTC